MKICENCGKEHDGSYGSGRFCSHSCQASFTNKNRGKRNQETIEKIIDPNGPYLNQIFLAK